MACECDARAYVDESPSRTDWSPVTSEAECVCPTKATLEPPTVRLVKVPALAVNVEAETWVALNDAVPVTFMSPKVALSALRLVNMPMFFSTLLDVSPVTFAVRLVMSDMLCLWSALAKLLVAADIMLSRPVISDVECECPSRETGFPSTVMLLASIELKFNWSNVVAA